MSLYFLGGGPIQYFGLDPIDPRSSLGLQPQILHLFVVHALLQEDTALPATVLVETFIMVACLEIMTDTRQGMESWA